MSGQITKQELSAELAQEITDATEHSVDDEKHIQPEERISWNNKADADHTHPKSTHPVGAQVVYAKYRGLTDVVAGEDYIVLIYSFAGVVTAVCLNDEDYSEVWVINGFPAIPNNSGSCFIKNGYLYVGGDNAIHRVNLSSGIITQIYANASAGRIMIGCDISGRIYFCEPSGDRTLLKKMNSNLVGVEWSVSVGANIYRISLDAPDGDVYVSTISANSLKRVSSNNGNVIWTYEHGYTTNSNTKAIIFLDNYILHILQEGAKTTLYKVEGTTVTTPIRNSNANVVFESNDLVDVVYTGKNRVLGYLKGTYVDSNIVESKFENEGFMPTFLTPVHVTTERVLYHKNEYYLLGDKYLSKLPRVDI